MGSFLDYHCRDCGNRIAIGGPTEFFRDAAGSRQVYGHPQAASAEAEAAGVLGFWMTLWCPACRRAHDVVTVEFEEPVSPLDAWAGRGRPRAGVGEAVETCPECRQVLSDEIAAPLPPCPACGAAALVCEQAIS